MLKNFALLGALIVAGVFPKSTTWVKASVSEKAPPTLKSVFPLGGNQGSDFAATVRGENLDAAYHVWFNCHSLSAAIEAIRQIDPDLGEGKPYSPPAPDAKKLERKFYELRLRVVVASLYREQVRRAEHSNLDEFQQQALEMILSPAVREAFDLSHEPEKIKDACGRDKVGQSA